MKQFILGALITLLFAGVSHWAGYARAKADAAPYSNDSLHQWACQLVLDYDRSHEKVGGGCYDVCDGLAYKLETTGYAVSPQGQRYKWHGSKLVPQGLGDEYWDGGEGYNIANACAITLNGAEW